MTRASSVLSLWLALSACAGPADDPNDPRPTLSDAEWDALRALRYDEAEPLPDPSNAYDRDPAARVFGQRLFYDPRLSGPLIDGDNDGSEVSLGVRGEAGRVSCAGCHVPESGFVDTRSRGQQVSLAARWTLRRTPSIFDLAEVPLYNWDGRRDSLVSQAIGVMESDREYNAGRLFVAEQIHRLHRDEYESIFGPLPPLDDASRFPPLAPTETGCDVLPGAILECRGRPGDGAEYDAMSEVDQRAVTEVVVNVGKALAAYVGQLRCGPSRFDAWLDGDPQALSPSEARGAALFVGRAGCVSCHGGPRLTDDAFHNVGLTPETVAVVIRDDDDRGAAEALPALLEDPLRADGSFSDGSRGPLPTPGPALEGAFRTPTLRCVAEQPSFMHTAQMGSLDEVVRFFDRGGHPPGGYPGTNELTPLGLEPGERDDLVAFLGALSGDGPPSALRVPPGP